MRDVCLLSTKDAVTDPDLRAAYVENGKRNYGPHVRSERSRKEPRRTAAYRKNVGAALKRWIDDNPAEMAALRAGFRARMTSPEVYEKWRSANATSIAQREWSDEKRAAFKELMASAEVRERRAAAVEHKRRHA
jgi:hypothetical protein